MKEIGWEQETPERILKAISRRASDRTLRLYVAAYVRQSFSWPPEHAAAMWHAIDVAERFADGCATEAELRVAHDGAQRAAGLNSRIDLSLCFMGLHAAAAASTAVAKSEIDATIQDYQCRTGPGAERSIEADRSLRRNLLRDIFGGKRGQLISFSLSTAIVDLSRTIYEERAFHRMPELADALEGEGCSDADVVAHCRFPGPHVRGCWALDLLLGKT